MTRAFHPKKDKAMSHTVDSLLTFESTKVVTQGPLIMVSGGKVGLLALKYTQLEAI